MEAYINSIGRFYKAPGGIDYPSVTTVLQVLDHGWLDEWREKIGEERADQITKEAADIGTHLHLLYEMKLAGRELPLCETPEQKKAFQMYRASSVKILPRIGEVLGQEVPLYTDQLRIAGRCDLIAEFDGKVCLIDFKNTRRDKQRHEIDAYRIQLKIYDIMIRERMGIDIEEHLVLMVTRDGFLKIFRFDPNETTMREIKDIRLKFYQQFGV